MPDLTVPLSDGSSLKAYLSTPTSGSGPWPGVVVIHDAFGLSKVTRGHADRLAGYGYVALAPDLYTRGGMRRCVKATFQAMRGGSGQAFDDIETCRAWLMARDDCADRVGIIGFCMGGGFALMTAARGFQVAAPNYGMLPKDLSALDGACLIVASYGAKDRQLKNAATKLESALSARQIDYDIKEYSDAGHSFMDQFSAGPLTPVLRVMGMGYNEAAAADAWNRIEAFFAEHLAS
jgi:carboxymethylenebutenolidase